MSNKLILVGALALGFLPMQKAQAARAPQPCEDDPTHEVLNFTLGDWDIYVNDKPVAWIKLEKVAANCLIREQYGVPVDGQSGAGLDYWDNSAKLWRRILVTSVGTVETFEGFQSGDKFVWNGREQRVNGDIVLERVEIWREGDTVRNDIFQSKDGGISWILAGSETRRQRSQAKDAAQ